MPIDYVKCHYCKEWKAVIRKYMYRVMIKVFGYWNFTPSQKVLVCSGCAKLHESELRNKP